MQLGLRVVRGADWKWDEQDGGEGRVGTVVKPGMQNCDVVLNDTVFVRWDSGQLANYRIGSQHAYDLCQFDNAAAGSIHKGYMCSECRQSEIVGIRWTCLSCVDVNLCRDCYGNDKHDVTHKFVRYDWLSSEGHEVSPRKGSRKVEAIGIFPGATVIRGPDWQWGNQDGGEGSLGLVLSLTDHRESQSLRSWCKVTWNTGNTNDYKIGHEGKLDLVMIEGATGGFYYPQHLAPLGHYSSLPPDVLGDEPEIPQENFRPKPGDKVQVNLDCDIFEAMQQNHGDWHPVLAKCIGRVGQVTQLLQNDVLVKFSGIERVWRINPAVLSPARRPFHKGDQVLISDDLVQVMSLQEGHGGWIPEMQSSLGETGTVVSEDNDSDVRVDVAGHMWTFNAACCTRLAPPTKPADKKPGSEHSDEQSSDEDSSDNDDDEEDTIVGNPRLEQMIRSLMMRHHQPDRPLLEAVAAGDTDTVKTLLAHLPSPPSMASRSTLCLALKAASLHGQVDVARLLLDAGADVSARDEHGDSQAHFAVFEDHPEVLSVLVEKGHIDVNITNFQRLTPLHVAVHKGHVECAKRLIAYGCDVNLTDSDDNTALHNAIRLGNKQLIDLLMANPIVFNFRQVNSRGFNVLHEAAFNNNCYAAEKVLRQAPSLIDQTKQDAMTALHLAAADGHVDVAKVLIQGKAKLDVKNSEGETALMLACHNGWIPMIELLTSSGADVNAADNSRNSPLHVILAAHQQTTQRSTSNDVVQNSAKALDKALSLHEVQSSLPGHLQGEHWLVVACYLIKHGADVTAVNSGRKTPMQYASDTVIADILRRFVDECRGVRQCQLCSKDEALTFMPCGHQIACKRCSARTKHCFTCRTPISQTILPAGKSALSVEVKSSGACSECAAQRGYLLRPCMHTCCRACGNNVSNDDKCPICRADVKKKVPLYGLQ